MNAQAEAAIAEIEQVADPWRRAATLPGVGDTVEGEAMNDMEAAARQYHNRIYEEVREERRALGRVWFGVDVMAAFEAGAEWQSSVGPAADDEPADQVWISESVHWRLPYSPGHQLLLRIADHKTVTRGLFRRLCGELGIPLKETP